MRGGRRIRGKESGAPPRTSASARRSGQELLPERSSLDELPDAGLGDKIAVLDEHVPTQQDGPGEPVTSVPS